MEEQKPIRRTGESLDEYIAERAHLHPGLTDLQMRVAYALAFGDDPEKVSVEFGVDRNEIAQLRADEAFREFELQVHSTSRSFRKGDHSTKVQQVSVLSDIAQRILDTIEARGQFYRGEVNGAEAGLMIMHKEVIRPTKHEGEVYDEWEFDPKPVYTLIAVYKQIGEIQGFKDKTKIGKMGQKRPEFIGLIDASKADEFLKEHGGG